MQLTLAVQQSAYQSCNLPAIIGLLIRVNWLLFLVELDVAVPWECGCSSSGFAFALWC